MDLDELKTAWRTLDRKGDASSTLHLAVLKELKVDKARSALGRLAWLVRVELASGVAAALVVGAFLADHIGEAGFAIPALVLQAVLALMIATAIRQLAMVSRIDYSAPVVTIQRWLTELRASPVRTTQRLLLFALLLWTPLAIVAARGLFDVDLYRGNGPRWLAANLALGLVAVPLMMWVTRRYADHFRRSPVLKRLSDDIAGRSLTAAMDYVDEIARFEKS